MGGRTSVESKDKWNKKAYDNITLRVKKGQKELFQQFAEAQEKSLNAFIVEAMREKMEREGKNDGIT